MLALWSRRRSAGALAPESELKGRVVKRLRRVGARVLALFQVGKRGECLGLDDTFCSLL